MGRASVKEKKNRYQRIREELGLTREKAADLLETIPPERIERIENERCEPYPEEILLMSQKYGKPSLCNYYCSNKCPIGKEYVPEVRVKELSAIVLEMLASLNAIQRRKERLVEIAADGEITTGEIDDFITIQDELEQISIAVETLQLWMEKMLASGDIDPELYRERKNK